MIFIKLFLLVILTSIFLLFSFSSRMKIFQKSIVILGYMTTFMLILFPRLSDKIAHMVSIKDGTSLVVYVVLALTSLVSMILYVGQKNNRYMLTKIIRERAKHDAKHCE